MSYERRSPSFLPTAMFSTLGLFQKLPCPERSRCTRPNCLFSHADDITQIPTVRVPVDAQKPQPTAAAPQPSVPQPVASTSKQQTQIAKIESSIPAKRPLSFVRPGPSAASSPGKVAEPPRKLQRVGNTQIPASVQTPAYTTVCTRIYPSKELKISIMLRMEYLCLE